MKKLMLIMVALMTSFNAWAGLIVHDESLSGEAPYGDDSGGGINIGSVYGGDSILGTVKSSVERFIVDSDSYIFLFEGNIEKIIISTNNNDVFNEWNLRWGSNEQFSRSTFLSTSNDVMFDLTGHIDTTFRLYNDYRTNQFSHPQYDYQITFVGDAAPQPVPSPAAVWLFGSGLFGLIGMRKKHYNCLT